MSSSPEQLSRRPRVGVIRGAVASDRPVLADVRTNLPAAVLDPVAMEAGRRAAIDDGYADGYAAGLATAQEEAAAQRRVHAESVMQAVSALMGSVNQLRTREAATLHHVADQTALLALHIAEVVLQREVACAADPGHEAMARAMALVPEEGDVRVHLHPDDLALLGPVDDLAPGRGVQLVSDGAVKRGGALVWVGATRVDAQIDSALQRVAAVLA